MIDRGTQIEIIKRIAAREVTPLAQWQDDPELIRLLDTDPRVIAAQVNQRGPGHNDDGGSSMRLAYACG